MHNPTSGPAHTCMLPPGSSAPSGHQTNQGGQALGLSSGPTLVEPTLVPRDGAAALSSPLVNPCEEELPFPGKGTIWHPQPKLWSLHL